MYKLGVIGLGTRIHKGVLPALAGYSSEFCITAAADPDPEKVRNNAKDNPVGYKENFPVYSDADEMLKNEDLDGIIVGTRCSLHTPLAIKAMERNVPIYLEKPVCISMEQIEELNAARKKYNPKVVVSFPLRYSRLAEQVKEMIDSDLIGEVVQVNAFNDVPYGRVYYHDWYRDYNETGGLWLQKATHDFDYLNYILGGRATEIFARSTHKIFKGDMPAGLKCADCDKYRTCPESPYTVNKVNLDPVNLPENSYCCFAKDSVHEDTGMALQKRDNGAIVSYEQNFFARMQAGRRGARFSGYKGTIEFDWVQGNIKYWPHTVERADVYQFPKLGGHFGGDEKLAELYYKMISGETEKSFLEEGIVSALQCLCARESCETGKNIIVPEL